MSVEVVFFSLITSNLIVSLPFSFPVLLTKVGLEWLTLPRLNYVLSIQEWNSGSQRVTNIS